MGRQRKKKRVDNQTRFALARMQKVEQWTAVNVEAIGQCAKMAADNASATAIVAFVMKKTSSNPRASREPLQTITNTCTPLSIAQLKQMAETNFNRLVQEGKVSCQNNAL